jgi:hypothetical protein
LREQMGVIMRPALGDRGRDRATSASRDEHHLRGQVRQATLSSSVAFVAPLLPPCWWVGWTRSCRQRSFWAMSMPPPRCASATGARRAARSASASSYR